MGLLGSPWVLNPNLRAGFMSLCDSGKSSNHTLMLGA